MNPQENKKSVSNAARVIDNSIQIEGAIPVIIPPPGTGLPRVEPFDQSYQRDPPPPPARRPLQPQPARSNAQQEDNGGFGGWNSQGSLHYGQNQQYGQGGESSQRQRPSQGQQQGRQIQRDIDANRPILRQPRADEPSRPNWPIQTVSLVNMVEFASDRLRIFRTHELNARRPEDVRPLNLIQAVDAMASFSVVNSTGQDLVVMQREDLQTLNNWVEYGLRIGVRGNGPPAPRGIIGGSLLVNVVNFPVQTLQIMNVQRGQVSAEVMADTMAAYLNQQARGLDLVVVRRHDIEAMGSWVGWILHGRN